MKTEWKIISLSPMRTCRLKSALFEAGIPRNFSIEIRTLPAGTLPSVLLEAVGEADILIGDYSFRIGIDRNFIAAAKRLQFIQQPSAGLDHIDLAACKEQNVAVANAASANAEAVAEHTLALAFMLLKNLYTAHQAIVSGEWPQFLLGNRELKGMTWGIVGMGKIGQQLARRLPSFGTEVVYYDVIECREADCGTLLPLEDLLSRSGIVSLHLPLTKQTAGLMNHSRLSSMKPGAFLINVARGGIVDEAALADHLSNHLAAAALDVFSTEPFPADSPLRNCANAIFTPHIAGVTEEARQRILRQVIGNVARFMVGQKPLDLVVGGQ